MELPDVKSAPSPRLHRPPLRSPRRRSRSPAGERCAVLGEGDAADAADGNVHLLDVGGSDLEAVDEGELDGRAVLERGEVERCVLEGRCLGDGIGAVVDGAEGNSRSLHFAGLARARRLRSG